MTTSKQTRAPSPIETLTVVMPVYNEEGNLQILYERLCTALEQIPGLQDAALLFVDDGSVDGSFAALQALQRNDKRVHVLKLSRNFGHHLAITAGIDHAAGDAVVLMDADLQDRPEEIPRLCDTLQEGFGVVYGLRRNKQFAAHKRWLSSGFRWLMKRWLGYPIEGGIFRILRRDVVEELKRCREVDRIVIGLTSWVGFRQTGIDVTHAARHAGETKYSLRKQLQLATNAMLAFSTRPLQLAWWVGLLCSLVGLVGIAWHQCGTSTQQIDRTSLLYAIVMMGGIQLLSVGVLGAYLGRIFRQTRGRPLYVVEAFLSEGLLGHHQDQEDDGTDQNGATTSEERR